MMTAITAASEIIVSYVHRSRRHRKKQVIIPRRQPMLPDTMIAVGMVTVHVVELSMQTNFLLFYSWYT